MTSTVPVILSQEPVTRGLLARMKVSTPNIAVVYSDAFGNVTLSRAPTELVSAGDVEIPDTIRGRSQRPPPHRAAGQLAPAVARVTPISSEARLTSDSGSPSPKEVVSRNVTDALPVVYNYLIDSFRPVTRQHEIDDAAGAEAQLNLLFRTPHVLDEGITIYHCTARLLPDAAAQRYLQSLNTATRTFDLNEREHRVATAAARHEIEIDGAPPRCSDKGRGKGIGGNCRAAGQLVLADPGPPSQAPRSD